MHDRDGGTVSPEQRIQMHLCCELKQGWGKSWLQSRALLTRVQGRSAAFFPALLTMTCQSHCCCQSSQPGAYELSRAGICWRLVQSHPLQKPPLRSIFPSVFRRLVSFSLTHWGCGIFSQWSNTAVVNVVILCSEPHGVFPLLLTLMRRIMTVSVVIALDNDD